MFSLLYCNVHMYNACSFFAIITRFFFHFILIKYELESYLLFLKVKNGFVRFVCEDNLPTKPTLVTHICSHINICVYKYFFIKQVYRYYNLILFLNLPTVTECDMWSVAQRYGKRLKKKKKNLPRPCVHFL